MTAEQIYDQHQQAKRNHESMGFTYHHPFGAMSAAEIQAHLDFCKQMSAEFHLNCYPDVMAGKSQEVIRAEMEAKSKAHKRGAGARALKAKYGKASAEKIIRRHTGCKLRKL